MSDPTTYAHEAAVADQILDEQLAAIRVAEDTSEITTAEAAIRRVTALEDHLSVIRALRLLYFGNPL